MISLPIEIKRMNYFINHFPLFFIVFYIFFLYFYFFTFIFFFLGGLLHYWLFFFLGGIFTLFFFLGGILHYSSFFGGILHYSSFLGGLFTLFFFLGGILHYSSFLVAFYIILAFLVAFYRLFFFQLVKIVDIILQISWWHFRFQLILLFVLGILDYSSFLVFYGYCSFLAIFRLLSSLVLWDHSQRTGFMLLGSTGKQDPTWRHAWQQFQDSQEFMVLKSGNCKTIGPKNAWKHSGQLPHGLEVHSNQNASGDDTAPPQQSQVSGSPNNSVNENSSFLVFYLIVRT